VGEPLRDAEVIDWLWKTFAQIYQGQK